MRATLPQIAPGKLRLRAERRLGEMLREVVEHHVGRNGSPDATHSLKGLGVTKDQSSKWQRVAEMPAETFERYLETAPMPTLKGALRARIEAEAAACEAESSPAP